MDYIDLGDWYVKFWKNDFKNKCGGWEENGEYYCTYGVKLEVTTSYAHYDISWYYEIWEDGYMSAPSNSIGYFHLVHQHIRL